MLGSFSKVLLGTLSITLLGFIDVLFSDDYSKYLLGSLSNALLGQGPNLAKIITCNVLQVELFSTGKMENLPAKVPFIYYTL